MYGSVKWVREFVYMCVGVDPIQTINGLVMSNNNKGMCNNSPTYLTHSCILSYGFDMFLHTPACITHSPPYLICSQTSSYVLDMLIQGCFNAFGQQQM